MPKNDADVQAMNNLSEWAAKNPKGYISIGDACGIQEPVKSDGFVHVGFINHGTKVQHAVITSTLYQGAPLYAKADDIAPHFIRNRRKP